MADWASVAQKTGETVLRAFAEDATYHQASGTDITLAKDQGEGVAIQKDVKMMEDATGVYTRTSLASLPSGLVNPQTGDWIEATENWEVEAIDFDDGQVQRLFVRPRS